MSRTMRMALLSSIAAIVLLSAGRASADERKFSWWGWWNHDRQGERTHNGKASDEAGGGGSRWIPEFDVAAVGAIAAIVAGGGVLLARRRRS